MATKTHGRMVQPLSIDTAELAAGAVTTAKLDDEAVTRSKLSTGSLPFLDAFVSADQVITAAGALTLAHGIATVPGLVQCRLKCTTAELGYTLGDEVVVNPGAGPAANLGLSLVVNDTNVVVRFGSDAAVLHVVRKDTGATAAITPASWSLIVMAWG